jgi:hypothetical protein
MMRRASSIPAAMLLAAALALGACATSERFSADVTRFHLGQPLARGSVFLETTGGGAVGPADRLWLDAVGAELRRQGFALAPTRDAAELVGVVGVARSSRQGPARSSPVSIGVGMGGGGRNVAGAVGVNVPVGSPRSSEIAGTTLTLDLRRASDATTVWEGRAITSASTGSRLAQPATLAPQLARALLDGFPGDSGRTVRFPPGRR